MYFLGLVGQVGGVRADVSFWFVWQSSLFLQNSWQVGIDTARIERDNLQRLFNVLKLKQDAY